MNPSNSDKRPLVLVTRPREQGQGLVRLLEQAGLEVLHIPAVEIVPLLPEALASHVAKMQRGEYSWVIFTSANSVRCFSALPGVAEALRSAGIKTAAVGAATAECIQQCLKNEVDLVSRYGGASLAEDLLPELTAKARVLFPCAAEVLPSMENRLEAVGVRVDRLTVYRSKSADMGAKTAAALCGRKLCITFCSPSAVRFFCDEFEFEGSLLVDARVVTIGRSTSEAAAARGLVVARESAVPSEQGMAAAVLCCLSEGAGKSA